MTSASGPRTGHKERHHYSGPASSRFWRRVNALNPLSLQRRIYSMGCALQAKEEQTIKALREAERRVCEARKGTR